MAMNSAVCNHQEAGSNTHSCHAEADIVHQVADVLVTNSAVFFLFPPKQRWQESRKTGKMRLRKTNEARKEPARRCSETAVAEVSAHFPIEKSVELREACGKSCLIQN
jgi:hypothetical protein